MTLHEAICLCPVIARNFYFRLWLFVRRIQFFRLFYKKKDTYL